MIEGTAERYWPVVAIQVEGLLAVDTDPHPGSAATEPARGAEAPEGTAAAEPNHPVEDEPGVVGRWRWLSADGHSWVLSLLDRGIEVVWWSRVHDSADGDFGHAPDLRQMPSARHLDQSSDPSAEECADSPLQARAKGRPLLIVTGTRLQRADEDYIRMRRPVDRARTALRTIPRSDDPNLDMMAEMDAWLALVRTPHGQEALRRHRRRTLARPRRGAARADRLGERLPPVSEVDALAARYVVVDAWVRKVLDRAEGILREQGFELADLGTVNQIVKMFVDAIRQAELVDATDGSAESDPRTERSDHSAPPTSTQ